MRTAAVAAWCIMAQAADAATWRCQNLGSRLCDGNKCQVQLNAPRYWMTVPEGISEQDGETVVVTPTGKRTAMFVTFAGDMPGATVNYGQCWPAKMRR